MLYVVLAIVLICCIVLAVSAAQKSKKGGPPPQNPQTPTYAQMRGAAGEAAVAEALGESEEGVRYVFSDYLTAWEHCSAEIDHILVEERGVFVIETKTYAGKIYGAEGTRDWTCVTQNGQMHTFYNPLMQSRKHAEVIRRLLPKAVPVYALAVFADGDLSALNCPFVFSLPLLKKAIASFPAGKLDGKEIAGVARGLKEAEGGITREEHTERVKRRTRMIEMGVCPMCGCPLERHGKTFRCSAYPKCKFVKKD